MGSSDQGVVLVAQLGSSSSGPEQTLGEDDEVEPPELLDPPDVLGPLDELELLELLEELEPLEPLLAWATLSVVTAGTA